MVQGTTDGPRTPDRPKHESQTTMSDQSKRRRDRTPDSSDIENSPEPSSKVRRQSVAVPYCTDEESDSSYSGQSEVILPDSVRRILDFDQWGASSASSNSSGSDAETDEAPQSIPNRSRSEPDVETPTGPDLEDFTDFSTRTWSPTSTTQTTAAATGQRTPCDTAQHPYESHAPGPLSEEHQRTTGQGGPTGSDAELTRGYITETDQEERARRAETTQKAITNAAATGPQQDWTPPPKRQRHTPPTAGTAEKPF